MVNPLLNIGALISASRQALADLEFERWESAALLEEAVREAAPYYENPYKTHGDFDFPLACMLLRISLTYDTKSPPIFEVMRALGRSETLKRLEAQMPTERLANLRLVEQDLMSFMTERRGSVEVSKTGG